MPITNDADGVILLASRMVVIDPRRTATCDIADLHLAVTPGGDLALFNGFRARAKTGQGRRAEIADLHCPEDWGRYLCAMFDCDEDEMQAVTDPARGSARAARPRRGGGVST